MTNNALFLQLSLFYVEDLTKPITATQVRAVSRNWKCRIFHPVFFFFGMADRIKVILFLLLRLISGPNTNIQSGTVLDLWKNLATATLNTFCP